MRIAIYQPRVSYYVGGGETLSLDHADYLNRLGHNVTIITVSPKFVEVSEYFRNFVKSHKRISVKFLGVPSVISEIYKIPAGSDWGRWNIESILVGSVALNYFKRNAFDLVAVYNILDMSAIPCGQKSALHLLGCPPKADFLYKTCIEFPDTILAVSYHVKNCWQKLAGVRRIAVVENGIKSDYFRPALKTKKKYDVLFIGRLIRIKGVGQLIKAAGLLKRKGMKTTIAIAGDGPDASRLKILSKKTGIGGEVKFLGYVPDDELVNLYNSSKISALPSLGREGIMITMLESSSCGVPVITTSAGSMGEFISNKRNGLIVKPGDERGLANAIRLLLKNDLLRMRLGNRARRDIIKSWDWRGKIKKLESIYEKTLSGN